MADDLTRKLQQELEQLRQDVRRLQRTNPLEAASVTSGRVRFIGGTLRVDSGGRVEIVGSLRIDGSTVVNGTFKIEGPWSLNGNGEIAGNVAVTGKLTQNGPWELRGNGDITGDVGIDGDLSLGSGRFLAGPLIIDKAGGYGARVYSTGTLLLDASSNVVAGAPFQAIAGIAAVGNITTTGNIVAGGDVGGGSKSFWIEHPTKEGHQLRHGSLEGPEHGVFYRGVVEFDADGEAVFELPEYFTALVLPDDVPTVQVTAIGRPFLTGAELVADGAVAVYGEPDRQAHVTVTAARELFDVEPVKPEPVVTPETAA